MFFQLIPGYCYSLIHSKKEDIVPAETSVGTGLIWGTAIDGEMKLAEEGVHRIDVILSVAPFLILSNWLQRGAICDESFRMATKNIYEIIEASFTTHLRLPTNISKEIRIWDEAFFRKIAKTEEDFQAITEYNKKRHLKTSNKLWKIYQGIESNYAGPLTSKFYKVGDSSISSKDILQHNILSVIVSVIINSSDAIGAMDYLTKKRGAFHYESTSELAQKLVQELKAAGYNIFDSGNLHARILSSYYMLTQAIVTEKVEIINEVMQELLGWLTASGFHAVFQIEKNRNHIEFQSYYRDFFHGKPSPLSDCFIDDNVYELTKLLPTERILLEDKKSCSKYTMSIRKALAEFFIKLENQSNKEFKCPMCNETLKIIRKSELFNSVTKNKKLMYEANNLYGEWIFNEIQNKSTNLLEKLKGLRTA